jgi:hypothetical protein
MVGVLPKHPDGELQGEQAEAGGEGQRRQSQRSAGKGRSPAW